VSITVGAVDVSRGKEAVKQFSGIALLEILKDQTAI
jgi:hypothetical protein